MDFDQVLEEIGDFGRYQRTNYLLICLPVMFAAANSLSYVFTAGTPSYRCLVPECENATSAVLHAVWLENALPGTTNAAGVYTPDTCFRYRPNDTDIDTNTSTEYTDGDDDDNDNNNNNNNTNTNLRHNYDNSKHDNNKQQHEHGDICPRDLFYSNVSERCFEWVYDTKEHTIVQEWQLTCKENSWKLAFVGTMHFAGLVVGTAASGYMADRYGRKIIFIICIVFMAVTGIAQGLAWNYTSFLTFALLNAIGTAGVYPLAFIIGVEMVGPRKREMSSIVLNYFYAVGEALVGLTAWWLHDWQLLQFALSVPPLFFIVYYWLVPESVRWLLARNQHEMAGRIIRRAAKVNRRELSIALLDNFKECEIAKQVKSAKTSSSNDNLNAIEPHHKPKYEIWLIVKEVLASKKLLIRYGIMMYIWVINSVVYYGLSLNSTNLSGNKYLNFALVCLIEIPGYTLAWILLNKLGRRFSLTGSLLLCAITCVAGGYITQDTNWAVITLFLLGKLGITSSFAVIYTYTAEMMPTLIRSGGVGVMSTSARFGAMVAPFVPLLAEYYEPLPLLLFGGVSFSAGMVALLLPETFRKKLPDTVAEAKVLGKTNEHSQIDSAVTANVADTTT